MVVVDVQGDLHKLVESLEHLGASTKYIKIDMLRKTGRGALSYVKKGYKKYLRQPTGALYRAYKATTVRKKGIAIVSAKKMNYIAAAHENGSIIKSKKYKYMTFRVGNHWVKTKSVTLPKSPFFSEGTADYVSVRMQSDIDEVMKKAIDKFNAQEK